MINTIIVGAGPYGLSLAAHLRQKGISFRIFGRLMDSWRAHMPQGMLLKSDGFASNISDPDSDYTLGQFCTQKGIPYADKGVPIKLETFAAYGMAFQGKKVPELEDKQVVTVDRVSEGFVVRLDTGETIHARRVVLAVGVTHFENVPSCLTGLSAEFCSHSARHSDVTALRGRKVIVLGAGSSALDLAGLMHEAGVDVTLVARSKELKFHSKSDKARPWWDTLRRPPSGLGPGWKSFFFANYPNIFHHLPEGLRLEAVRRVLGPSGGAFIKDKVVGKVPLVLGFAPESATIKDGKVHLNLKGEASTKQEIVADHVVAATGYKVRVDRLNFLSAETRSKIKTVQETPVLSANFESSVPGLYFVGLAAANSFGPVMRFAFGADFAARTVSRALAKSVGDSVAFTAPATVSASK